MSSKKILPEVKKRVLPTSKERKQGKKERDFFIQAIGGDGAKETLNTDFTNTGDLQVDADNAARSIADIIRRNRDVSEERAAIIEDRKFYCCLIFQTEEQKLEFMRRAGWMDTTDYNNFDNMYINGLEVARRMGIELKPIELPNLALRDEVHKYRKEVRIYVRS